MVSRFETHGFDTHEVTNQAGELGDHDSFTGNRPLAEAVDRRRSLTILCLQQAVFSVLLALVTVPDDPNRGLLVAMVLAVGIGNALYAPIFSAVVPILVPREDLPGAISLNSVQMNASRVVGPFIGATIYSEVGPSWVFVLNAVSFGFVLLALARVTLPPPESTGDQGLHRLLEGLRVARTDRVVGQCLGAIATFSFFCLPFITQLPTIADRNLGIDTDTIAYGLLYGCFGTGAVIGALSIGTVFAGRDKASLTRVGLLGFAGWVLIALSTIRPALSLTWSRDRLAGRALALYAVALTFVAHLVLASFLEHIWTRYIWLLVGLSAVLAARGSGPEVDDGDRPLAAAASAGQSG